MKSRYLVGGAVLAVGAAAAVATGLPGGSTPASEASTIPAKTAEITRQTLVDRESESGELGYSDAADVPARESGTLTSLAAQGSTISRGKALYRLDDKPVVLLYGKLPAYRKLGPGDEGRDVKQLEQNLWALGYRGFTVDSSYTYATAEVVEEWQDDLGREETGEVGPATIFYAPGAVRIDSRSAEAGDLVQPGADLLGVTGRERIATVSLDVSDQRFAKKGAEVTITLPDDKEVKGRITGVETVVTAAESPQDEDTTTVEVTIGGFTYQGMDDATVDVDFTVSRRDDVLTVPVAALLALSEGGYGIQVVDGDATRVVAVRTGLFADGRVEINGDGITAGLLVGMPS